MAAKKKGGFALEVDSAPPPDKIGSYKEPAPEDDTDESAGGDDRTVAISAIHDLARAFGVTVKDEDAAVDAVYDLIRCAPKTMPGEE